LTWSPEGVVVVVVVVGRRRRRTEMKWEREVKRVKKKTATPVRAVNWHIW